MKRSVVLLLGALAACTPSREEPTSRLERAFGVEFGAELESAPKRAGDFVWLGQLGFRLLDANPNVASTGGGVYVGAAPGGGDVVLRAVSTGIEDFVELREAPPHSWLDYEIDVRGAAGLRVVGNQIELLEASGAPRWRVAHPYLIDSRRRRFAARLSLHGCAADTSPRAPWGRPVLPPGASRCRVRVSWPDAKPRYPVLVDPTWTTTAAMTSIRAQHTATTLPNGKVLVAGGHTSAALGSADETPSAELFDPVTGTWAATGAMSLARAHHAAAALVDGRVLVAGGWGTNGDAIAQAEVYSPSSGAWAPTGSMLDARTWFPATVLTNGEVLVTGGADLANDNHAEIFDPVAGTWSAVPNMLAGRSGHTSTLLVDGRVLVAGSEPAAEMFDPNSKTWTEAGQLNQNRFDHQAIRLIDGRVLVVGGRGGQDSRASAEVFDPQVGAWNLLPSKMSVGRAELALARLPSGAVLAIGGYDSSSSSAVSSVDSFDSTAMQWTPFPPMAEPRYDAAAAQLLDGRVLVAGGVGLSSAEIVALVPAGGTCQQCAECASGLCALGKCGTSKQPDGEACVCDTACASGFCVDGVCCDSKCAEGCFACSAAKKGKGDDGTCEAIAAGLDPDGECSLGDGGVSACGKQPACNGSGDCVCEQVSPASCDGDHTLTTLDKAEDCSPYRCDESPPRCLSACESSNDCVPGYVCDQLPSGGVCIRPQTGETEDPSCGCRSVPRRGGGAALFALVGLTLFVVRRKWAA